MFKPTKETIERINKVYGKFAELSDEIDKAVQEMKLLADMERLDEKTEGLIQYTDMLKENFDSAFIASEELTCLLEQQ